MSCLPSAHLLGRFVATSLIAASMASVTLASDLKPLTVVLSFVPSVENFGPYYAKASGLFEKAGLDVTIVPGGMGVDQVQMIDTGLAQLGMISSDSVIAAVDKGAPIKVIAGQFQKTPVAMTCRQDSRVTSPAELKGKRLGVKPRSQAYAETFLPKNGVSMDEVEVTVLGDADISLLIAGKIDCMLTTHAFNEPRLIEAAGVPVNVILVGEFGMNSQSGSWIVRADFLADDVNKATLAAYMSAEAEAWQVMFDDPAKAAQFMIDSQVNAGLNLDQQRYQAIEQAKFMTSEQTREHGILWINEAAWRENAQNAFDAGTTGTLVDPSTFLTTEILDLAARPKL